jgi:NAD(P)-dependent dehydrogenase (short-subunit alcohol dehydrogenase family)
VTLGDLVAAVEAWPDHAVEQTPPLQLRAGEAGVPAGRLTGRIDQLQAVSRASFDGKVAFVSGAGHGIGQVIATRLAELGAQVIVNSFHSRDRGEAVTAAIRAEGGRADHLWGSVANPKHVRQMFATIERQFGHLDFLVSNASNGIVAPLSEVTEQHWDRAFGTNIIGLHQCALLATPLMQRRGGGKIVTISSPGAHRYIEYFGCMGPIKAAVESLTLYLAIELAPHNIQVNCVSAGPVYGELLSRYPNAERLIPYWESLSAGRQLGHESDIADFVMLLLSNATDKITGSTMLVDAGGSQRI